MKKNKKNNSIKSIAVLCSGGDAPGMNAAIRAVVRYGITQGVQVHGVYRGYAGLLEGQIEVMSLRSVANVIQRGGTILKTSRCPEFFEKKYRAEAADILRRKGIDALVVIGGDGSYTGAHFLNKETGLPVVGLPGTIDNDIWGSDYTIGFDTAVNTAVEAIDKIRDTASSHDRVFLVEVMGRTSTEIATRVAISGGAEDVSVYGEDPQNKNIIDVLKNSLARGKMSSIIIVTEGSQPGHSDKIKKQIKEKAGLESRVVILGHLQRGGTPSAHDRYMASLMGAYGVECLLAGKKNGAVSLVQGKLALVPLRNTIGKHKKPDEKVLELVRILAN